MSRARHASFVVVLTLLACGDAPELRVDPEPSRSTPPTASATPAAAPAGEAAPPEGAVGGSDLVSGPGAPSPSLPPNHPAIDLPPAHPPVGGGAGATGATTAQPIVPAGSGVGATGLSWTPPQGWGIEPPANVMRKAQYRVPGPGGDGECVVFYLGPGQGGDARTNAERWASQFVQPDGSEPLSAMRTHTLAAAGKEALVVESRGTYMSGGMMGSPTVPKPGWALLGAVVPGPDADWYFKLTGPETTVAAQKTAFETMIASARPGS